MKNPLNNNLFLSTSVTLIIVLLGFLRDLILSYKFGASIITDAFLMSSTFQTIFFAGIANAVLQSYIPLYYEKESNNQNGTTFTNRLIKIVFILIFAYSIILFLLKGTIVDLIAHGFSEEGKKLTESFFTFQIIYGLFLPIVYIFRGYLRIKSRFFTSSAVMIPTSIITICGVWFSNNNNLVPIYSTYIIGILIALFSSIIAVKKEKFKFNLFVQSEKEEIKVFLLLLGPILLSDIVNQINIMVGQSFASMLDTGSVSALSFANKINALFIALFVSSIIMVVFPKMSKHSSSNNKRQYSTTYGNAIIMTELFALPIVGMLVVLADPIIRLVYQRGAFDEQAVIITSESLIFYSLGLCFIAFNRVTSSFLLSIKQSKIVFYSTIITLITNFLSNLVLIQYYGHIGIALSASISSLITSVYLYIKAMKHLESQQLRKLWSPLIRIIFASFVIAIVLRNSYEFFDIIGIDFIFLKLIMSIITGIAVFIILLYLLSLKNIIMNSLRLFTRKE